MNTVAWAEGIDVSNNNGDVNWEHWEGIIDFAEIKATEGLGFKDPLFAVNWAGARSIGVRRFAYHYGRPGTDPSAQAQIFTRYVRDHGVEAEDHYVLDLETTDGKSPAEVSWWGYVFCREMNRLNPGHRIIVQSYPAFIEAGNCAKLGGWHLWVMQWGTPAPTLPVGPWRNWAMWQFASAPGVVDLDRFHGPPSLLEAFCKTTGPSGP